MTTHQAITKRIIDLCKQNNITIIDLCKESNVPHSTVKSIFHGESKNPGVITIQKLCNGLNITLFEFFNHIDFK